MLCATSPADRPNAPRPYNCTTGAESHDSHGAPSTSADRLKPCNSTHSARDLPTVRICKACPHRAAETHRNALRDLAGESSKRTAPLQLSPLARDRTIHAARRPKPCNYTGSARAKSPDPTIHSARDLPASYRQCSAQPRRRIVQTHRALTTAPLARNHAIHAARRTTSPAIAPSGNTWCTADSLIASPGMPNTTDVASSCAIV